MDCFYPYCQEHFAENDVSCILHEPLGLVLEKMDPKLYFRTNPAFNRDKAATVIEGTLFSTRAIMTSHMTNIYRNIWSPTVWTPQPVWLFVSHILNIAFDSVKVSLSTNVAAPAKMPVSCHTKFNNHKEMCHYRCPGSRHRQVISSNDIGYAK